MPSCYNRGMKRLWPVPVLLLLALSLRAQERGAPPSDSPADITSPDDKSPGGEGDAPVTEPSSDTPAEPASPPEGDGGDGADAAEKPIKEEPVVSVKMVSPAVEEGDEDSIAPGTETKKVVPTATLSKPKKGKPAKGSKASKGAKGKAVAMSAPIKAKAPAIPAEAPPPPPPAVPLTPITPRNP